MVGPNLMADEREEEVDPQTPPPRSLLAPIVFGQVLSFLVAIGAVCTKMLYTEYKFSSPALQNMLGYALTFMVFVIPCAQHVVEWKAALAIALVAIADSQADFLGSLAYSYGVSIASVGMLASFTIPCAMLFSYLFLHVRYLRLHFAGCLVAFLGLVFVVLADVDISNNNGTEALNSTTPEFDDRHDPVFGDFLVIVGSAVYAAANVATEKFVKAKSLIVYLVWLCLFGWCISCIQFLALEQENLAKVANNPDIWLLFVPAGVLFCVSYYTIGKYLQLYDSVMFNLSLLTTDVWGILFGAHSSSHSATSGRRGRGGNPTGT
ncbi:hypothetical protein BASA81_007766 [Batrachochytrium salamandrivorans]|nr:hypothetical protein BASA81_007766 [Batrachochytrium salamandrivorans]